MQNHNRTAYTSGSKDPEPHLHRSKSLKKERNGMQINTSKQCSGVYWILSAEAHVASIPKSNVTKTQIKSKSARE